MSARPAPLDLAAAAPAQPLGGALLTADEVAKRLRVTKGWVYAQTRAGQMPHVRLGRYVRCRDAAVEQWLAELEQQSPHGPLGAAAPERRSLGAATGVARRLR